MVSVHNPFRSPAVTPVPTGRTGNSSPPLPPIPLDDDSPTQTSYAPPPGPPPESIQQPSSGPGEARSSVADILTEELPPAYTAAPNLREGESTLELGPRRPFQQPAAVPRRQELQFPPDSWTAPDSWSASSSHTTGNSWSSFPGNLHRSQTGVDRSRFVPPPQHPNSQRLYETRVRPTSHPNVVSDFARDFYAVGADDSGLYGGSSNQYQSSSVGASPVSPSVAPPASTGFAPPSPDRPDHPTGRRENAPSNGVPDDGRPTDRPIPGHPLLRHGKVLVYPNGYECHKCQNTGYKNYDPSHPCSRCWEKYAKPFSGPITYASWSSDGQSGPSPNFQRPLPTFRAPQASLHNYSSSWSGSSPGSSSDLSRSATTSRATYGAGGYPGASTRVMPIAGGILPMSSYLDRLGTRVGGLGGLGPRTGFPPPTWAPAGQLSGTGSSGAVVVYPPGDSRIGGRLCWRCGGSGKTSFLIFDETTCSVCDGVGRTFV